MSMNAATPTSTGWISPPGDDAADW
jgi:hypothetical protein